MFSIYSVLSSLLKSSYAIEYCPLCPKKNFYIYIYIYVYIHTDTTKRLTLLRVRAYGKDYAITAAAHVVRRVSVAHTALLACAGTRVKPRPQGKGVVECVAANLGKISVRNKTITM